MARDGSVYIVRWSVSAKRSYFTGCSAKGRRRAVALLSTYTPTYVYKVYKTTFSLTPVGAVVMYVPKAEEDLYFGVSGLLNGLFII